MALIGYLARLWMSYKFIKLTDDAERSRKALESMAHAQRPRNEEHSLGGLIAENRKRQALAGSAEIVKRGEQNVRLYDEGYESPKRIYAKNALTTTFQWAAGHQMHARYNPKKGVYAVTNTLNMTVDIYQTADFHRRFGLWES